MAIGRPRVGQCCHPHLYGVTPDAAPFFVAGCPKCEDKKARGLVTGNEPAPYADGKTRLKRTFGYRLLPKKRYAF